MNRIVLYAATLSDESALGWDAPVRGVMIRVRPWNVPLAIFTGHIAAAQPLDARTPLIDLIA